MFQFDNVADLWSVSSVCSEVSPCVRCRRPRVFVFRFILPFSSFIPNYLRIDSFVSQAISLSSYSFSLSLSPSLSLSLPLSLSISLSLSLSLSNRVLSRLSFLNSCLVPRKTPRNVLQVIAKSLEEVNMNRQAKKKSRKK